MREVYTIKQQIGTLYSVFCSALSTELLFFDAFHSLLMSQPSCVVTVNWCFNMHEDEAGGVMTINWRDRWFKRRMYGWWFGDSWCIASRVADTNRLGSAVECVSRAQGSESQCPVSDTDLWGYAIRMQGCIFSAQRSHRSSSDRRLLTPVIGCYLGGCQLKRQLSTFYASSVCLECQRSGGLNVWSVFAGHWEFRVHLRVR